MRTFSLMRALKAFVAGRIPAGLPRTGVYVGGLPDDEEDVFPFVVLRFAEGSIEEGPTSGACTDKVLLHIGVREAKSLEDATFACLGVCDGLRAALWRERLLDGRYKLEEVRAVLPEPERAQHEYHVLTLVTSWTYLVPPRDAGNDYRDGNFVHPKE